MIKPKSTVEHKIVPVANIVRVDIEDLQKLYDLLADIDDKLDMKKYSDLLARIATELCTVNSYIIGHIGGKGAGYARIKSTS